MVSFNNQIHCHQAQSIPVLGSSVVSPVMALTGLGQLILGAGGTLIGKIKDCGKQEKSAFQKKSIEWVEVGGKNFLYSVINTLSLGIFGFLMKKEFNNLQECGMNQSIHKEWYGKEMSEIALWFGTDYYRPTSESEIQAALDDINECFDVSNWSSDSALDY